MKTCYVFFGYWAEYVLSPLYHFMKNAGYDCIEVTPDTCINMRETLLGLRGRDIIFITSAHVFLDEHYHIYSTIPGSLSALEAMDILRPKKSVYYPHDLSTLLHTYDMPWMYSIFNELLFPLDNFVHLSCEGRAIYNVGWIKKDKKLQKGTRFTVAHAFSEEERFYNEGTWDDLGVFEPLWSQGVIVKGVNRTLADEFEAELNKRGVTVVNTRSSIYTLIENSEIMLTNALTSVNVESSLSGRYTINLLDGIFSHEEHVRAFCGLQNFDILTLESAAELLKQYYAGDYIPVQGEDLLKPFDFEFVTKLISKS